MDVEELSVGGYQLSDGGERIEGGERVKLKVVSWLVVSWLVVS